MWLLLLSDSIALISSSLVHSWYVCHYCETAKAIKLWPLPLLWLLTVCHGNATSHNLYFPISELLSICYIIYFVFSSSFLRPSFGTVLTALRTNYILHNVTMIIHIAKIIASSRIPCVWWHIYKTCSRELSISFVLIALSLRCSCTFKAMISDNGTNCIKS